MATSTSEHWSTATFTLREIVTKHLLPIPVLGVYKKQNQIFNLEATIKVDQVTVRVEDSQITAPKLSPIIINIPQSYSGLFTVGIFTGIYELPCVHLLLALFPKHN